MKAVCVILIAKRFGQVLLILILAYGQQAVANITQGRTYAEQFQIATVTELAHWATKSFLYCTDCVQAKQLLRAMPWASIHSVLED